jgi:hypothetical protein
MVLGHWPQYNHPDPKTLGFTLHHGVVTLGMMGLPVACVLGLALGMVILARTRRAPIGLLLASLGTPLLVMAVLRIDPLGLADWFLD